MTASQLRVSWDEYHRSIELLALKIHDSGWRFDQILCLARGGLRIGDVFSRVFQVPLAILSTSSYREEAGTVQGQLSIGIHLTQLSESISGKLLVVDDLVDTGLTFTEVEAWLRSRFDTLQEIRTAVIWYKPSSQFQPDYFLETVDSATWIQQPFEAYDAISIEDLRSGSNSVRT